jgi:simple sugar transport system permease protein
MAGAIMATWVGISFPGLPRYIHLPLIILFGCLAGGIWASVPALLKTRFQVDDVVTTLLLNYVMLHIMGALLFGPLQQPRSSWPRSPAILMSAEYPKLIARSRFHLGILLAVIAVLIIWFMNKKTVLGYQTRAVGVNQQAAFFGGINTGWVTLKTAMISGGLAAMAGIGEVCAIHYHLLMDISPGYGYSGIVIAMLGNLHPIGVLLSALFFSIIIVGAQTMSRMTGVPTYIAEVIQGMALMVMLIALLLTEYRVKVVKQ